MAQKPKRKQKRPVMAIWRTTHLYSGLVLFAFLFVLAASGSILVFKNDMLRLGYHDIPNTLIQMNDTELAERLEAISAHYRARFPDSRINIAQPTKSLPVFHAYVGDVEAFIHPKTGEVIDEWRWYERPLSFIFKLHHYLLAGETGLTISGLCGLFAVFMLVGGLVLWWPTRHRFALNHFAPRDMRRRTLIRLHRDLGLLFAPILFIVLLSGAGVVFSAQAQFLLNGLFGNSPPSRPAIALDATSDSVTAHGPWLEEVHAALPQATLRFYAPPMPGSAVQQYRMRVPSEWHPNGRSYVTVNGETGAVLNKIDAADLPTGQKINNALYPLHAGFVGGWAYKLLVFFSGLALMTLSMSGFLSYMKRVRRSQTSQGRAQSLNRLA